MRIRAILLVTWSLLAVGTLAWSLYTFRYIDSRPNSDAETLLYGIMAILTFPAGPLVVMAVGAAFWAVNTPASSVTLSRLVAVWIAMVFGGYLQWFHLMPWLYRSVKRKYAIRRNGLSS